MNFSEEWKSSWSISSVYSAPLLYSGAAAGPLGPLSFRPIPSSSVVLFSSPLLETLIPPNPNPKPQSFVDSFFSFYNSSHLSFIPAQLLSSIALDCRPSPAEPPLSFAGLHLLRRRFSGDFLLFFTTGENADSVAFITFSPSDLSVSVDADGDAFQLRPGLGHRILKLSVSAAVDGSSVFPSADGFVLSTTLYSIHWFAVESGEKPGLVHLAWTEFGCCISDSCWSPHLYEESVVLLENGELHVFDLNSLASPPKGPVRLWGSKVRVLTGELGSCGNWFRCEFSWHPRILIVARSDAVFLVDLRVGEAKVCVLAKIEMCDSYRVLSMPVDHFIAFCQAGFDKFYFSVATEYHLLLFDVRQPSIPVLQWVHGLDSPRYISMYRLSELRPSTKDGKFRWASESGFAIVLGSFWNCQFSVFCCGPTYRVADDRSVVSKIAKFCNSLYAWELPSGLSFSGHECCCGDCLLREDFSQAEIPVGIDWQCTRELVLGFCIISEDPPGQNCEYGLNSTFEETDGLGGFTLIMLTSSGKLKAQRYQALWDSTGVKSNCQGASLHFDDSILYSWSQHEEVSFGRLTLFKFHSLLGYLSGDLANVLASRMLNLHKNCETQTIYCTKDSRELIFSTLKAAGIDQNGPFPAIADVLNAVDFPTSIREIASGRLWAGLSLEILQLAFFRNSDYKRTQRRTKSHFELFLDIPFPPHVQLPPFFWRKALHGERETEKLSQGVSLVGPVLPLPVLMVLKQIGWNGSDSGYKKEVDGHLVESTLIDQCNEVTDVANFLLSQNAAKPVSLAEDTEEWVASQEMQDEKPFLLYEPQAFLGTTATNCEKNPNGPCLGKEETDHMGRAFRPQPMSEFTFEGKEFNTFIFPNQSKEATLGAGEQQFGLEWFDDLSPVRLKFDLPIVNFSPEELKIYKNLKRQFSKWQESFKPFQDFCSLCKLPKEH